MKKFLNKIWQIFLFTLIYALIEAIHYLAFSLANLTLDIFKYSNLTLNIASIQFFLASMGFVIYFFMITSDAFINEGENKK